MRARIQTFAARRPVVRIPSWAILTVQGSHRVGAFTFTVTAAVVVRALVHIYVHKCVCVRVCVRVCVCVCVCV